MQVKVRVSGYNAEGTRFVEDTNTVEISAFGGSVILQTRGEEGTTAGPHQPQSKVTVECLVVYHEAKGTAWLVGLAFIVANQSFWPIAFPPADWSNRDSETTR